MYALEDCSDNPRMWTCLDIHHWCDYWALVLERSKRIPLSVRIRLWGDLESEMATLMKDNNLCRSLALMYAPHNLRTSLELDATHLEDLTVDVIPPSAGAAPLTSYKLPLLRTLNLTRCYLPWLAGKYRNLTCIKIWRVNKFPTSVDFSWDFGVMLQESPDLESIDLFFATGDSGWSSFVTAWHLPGSRLRMHKLRHIGLGMRLDATMHILHSLETPRLKSIDIMTLFGPGDTPAVEALCSAEYVPASLFADMRELAIVQAPGFAQLLGITTDREFIGDALMSSYELCNFQHRDVDISIRLRYWDLSPYPTICPFIALRWCSVVPPLPPDHIPLYVGLPHHNIRCGLHEQPVPFNQ